MKMISIRRALNARRHARNPERGMTLLEIMVVITIIGVVMAIVGVAVIPQLDTARVDATKTSMQGVQTAMKLYYTRHGKYPDTGSGFQALVSEGMLEQIPKDGWNNPFTYLNEGGKPNIVSYGADGVPGGDGKDADISSLTLGSEKK